MLGLIRRLTHSRVGLIVTFGVLVLIALAFAAADVTGFGSGSGGITGGSVAEVGGTDVGAAELRRRAQDEVEALRQQQPALDMAQFVGGGGVDAALERIVSGAALEAFGHDQGMVVGKRLVDGQLASIPALQGPTGRFDQRIYEQLLAQRRLTDAGIRADIARDTMAQHLILPTIGASQVPRTLSLPYASLLLERRAGQIGFVPTTAVANDAAPSDSELQAWYRRNIARYSLPERRIVRFARITPDQLRANTVPSDVEIARAYQQARQRYAPTERRDVTQVIVLTQSAADALAARVRGGAPLAEAARAAGLESRTVADATKASYAAQASPAAADAVFSAAGGALVGPVRGAIGFVVARVDGIEQVAGKSLAEARGEIATALTAQKAAEAIAGRRDTLDQAITDGSTLAELVADQKLEAQTTPALTATGVDPTVATPPDPALAPIVAAGFAAEEGDTPTIVQTGQDGSFAVVALDRIVRAAPRPLADVRTAVARDVAQDRARRAARQLAGTILAKVNRNTPLPRAFAQSGTRLPAPRPLAAARSQVIANPGGAPAPLALMFSMAQGTAKLLEAPNAEGWYIVRLDTIVPGDAARQPNVVTATRRDLGRVVGREYVQQFTRAVQQAVGVRKDGAAVARVKADLTGQGGSNPR